MKDNLQIVSREENRSLSALEERFRAGKLSVPRNPARSHTRVVGIGESLRTKVNANIGTSKDRGDLELELDKLAAALAAGADTVMDLSTGGDLSKIRRRLLAACDVPFGTVPVYQVLVETIDKKKSIKHMDPERLFAVIEEQAADGVDFMTLHCGVTRQVLKHLQQKKRLMGIVSRGGTFMAEWVLLTQRENPLYEHFDRLLELAVKYEFVLSLGDGLRPGALADAGDGPQVAELLVLGELTERARARGVQVIVEGPGHVPLDQIESNIRQQKNLCKGAPFYVLGPLVTDIAPGYDHITSAIGGAIAAAAGADYLCYVTPSEHLGLPGVEEVRQGVVAARIAAHAADIAKKVPGALARDEAMSAARRSLDWERQFSLALDPVRARKMADKKADGEKTCSMCGEFCVLRSEHSNALG